MKFLIFILFMFPFVGNSQFKHYVSLFAETSGTVEIDTDLGIQYRYHLTPDHSLQTNVSTSISFGQPYYYNGPYQLQTYSIENKFLTTSIDYLYHIPILKNQFSFLLGGGLNLDFFKEKRFSNRSGLSLFSFRPQSGLDYYFKRSPIGLFVAYRPRIYMHTDVEQYRFSFQMGVRVGFNGKEKSELKRFNTIRKSRNSRTYR